MALDVLASEITTTAKKEAKAITDVAKAEAKASIATAEEGVESIHTEAIAKAERECAQIKAEIVASARQGNQKSMLIARREELDTTWESITKMVGLAKLNGRSGLLKSLVSEAKSDSDKDMILRPVSIDRPALEKAGGGFELGDDIAGLGGFVLEIPDGSVVLDYRFDSRLEESWNEALPLVTSILFGDS